MRLKTQSVGVAAPRELVFEVVASGGKDVGQAEDGRLVEFQTEWGGRVITTTEAVSLEPPHRISYRWLTGPLIGVEEEILLEETGPVSTEMTYRGRFRTPKGIVGWFRGASVVRPIFNKLVRQHLEQGRGLAEARARRSRVYPTVGHAELRSPRGHVTEPEHH